MIDVTANQYAQTLTGWDELAIAKAFGCEMGDMIAAKRQTTTLRALIFVELRRQGSSDKDAKKAALDLTVDAINDYFADDEADEDSETGKDTEV